MQEFTVDGRMVLLIHLEGGAITATQPMCPHQDTPLVDGDLEGSSLICSAHLWEFDVAACRGLNPAHAELANYPVRIEDDDIHVDLDADRPRFTPA